MALTALIAAYQLETGGAGRLRATLPVAGRTLFEYQARQAARAGASQIVALVERMPAELLAAIDRLRADHIKVDIARTVADAADRIHPEASLLFIGDGVLAGEAWIGRIAAARAPTVLTVADGETGDECERIDAGTRWAGLALLDGARLQRVAAMLGEWDLQSTLLRSAVQESAQRIDASGAMRLGDTRELWLVADGPARLAGFDRKLAGRGGVPFRDWTDRLLGQAVAGPLLPPLLRGPAQPWWLSAAAITLTLLAAALFLWGWRWPALIALMLSGPLLTLRSRLDSARLLPDGPGAQAVRWRDRVAALPLLAFGWAMTEPAGWGAVPLALIPLLAMAALQDEVAMLRSRGAEPPGWIAGVDALVWTFLPLALLGGWLVGLGATGLYAVASFVVVQRALRSTLAPVV